MSHATSLRQAYDTTYDCRSVLKHVHVLKSFDIFLTYTPIVTYVVNCNGAYEVKKDSFLFERLFKVKKNAVFILAISFLFLEIYTFLYYANEESDDVIGGSPQTVQHSIKNVSRNIGAVFLKLDTRNVHHQRESMTPTVLLSWQHSRLHSLSVKN